jgi:hypothetical protein
MAGFSVVNRAEIEKKVRASMEKFKGHVSVRIMEYALAADMYLKSLTPVHTGETVRNYIWTTGAPFIGHFAPIDNGPTGKTNSMPLGMEPRRHANEVAAFESFMAVNWSDPFQSFYCTNNSPQVGGLELGLLPGAPMKSRSPHGMFGLTHEYVMTLVRVKGFTR